MKFQGLRGLCKTVNPPVSSFGDPSHDSPPPPRELPPRTSLSNQLDYQVDTRPIRVESLSLLYTYQ